jgi:hypothetical protein
VILYWVFKGWKVHLSVGFQGRCGGGVNRFTRTDDLDTLMSIWLWCVKKYQTDVQFTDRDRSFVASYCVCKDIPYEDPDKHRQMFIEKIQLWNRGDFTVYDALHLLQGMIEKKIRKTKEMEGFAQWYIDSHYRSICIRESRVLNGRVAQSPRTVEFKILAFEKVTRPRFQIHPAILARFRMRMMDN